MTNKKNGKKSVIRMIADIVSWTIFALLMLLAAFLIYYVIANNIYASKGERFKPIVSLYTIISGSMLPTIQVYDVVVNQRIDEPTKLQEGDIITFISQSKINYGETITHRIINVSYEDGKYYYTTKGDYNLVPDESPVEFNNIIGKVILKLPQLGRAQFFLLQQGSKLFLILIPAFGVLIYDLLKMLNLAGTKKKVDKSLKTKEYKLSKEEEEELKAKIKERLINKDTKVEESPKEEIKAIESQEEPILIKDKEFNKEEEIASTKNNDIPETNIIENKPIEEVKINNKKENLSIDNVKKNEPKHSNKNSNANRNTQSKKKTSSNNKTNNYKKRTTSKKTNYANRSNKTKQDIDVDKVLEKIKEKKY